MAGNCIPFILSVCRYILQRFCIVGLVFFGRPVKFCCDMGINISQSKENNNLRMGVQVHLINPDHMDPV